MREIKFRAWNKISGEMWSHEDSLSLLLLQGRIRAGTAADTLAHLSEYEIMQSTGLRDKNGKEIFEGDIAKDEEGPHFVEWCEKYGYWAISTAVVPCCDYLSEWQSDFKVIGNIYEHPELLG